MGLPCGTRVLLKKNQLTKAVGVGGIDCCLIKKVSKLRATEMAQREESQLHPTCQGVIPIIASYSSCRPACLKADICQNFCTPKDGFDYPIGMIRRHEVQNTG
jgi:hypothetical protein